MIYLDNAATTFPKPQSVLTAFEIFMKTKAANPGRSGHKMSIAAAKEVFDCRETAAEFFNAPGPECVSFCMNATQAINMAIKGYLCGNGMKSGHVITSDLEHNSVLRPLKKLEKDGVITLSVVPVNLMSDEVTVEEFRSRITSKTVLIACTHASNVCGKILPIEKIGKLCLEYSLKFLVDASQSAGLVDIDMKKSSIDFLCMPGHKCLYGPMGTGMLICGSCEGMNTILEGGTGSNSTEYEQPDFMPDIFESGTLNAPGIAALNRGMKFAANMMKHGGLEKEKRCSLELFDRLALIKGVRLYTKRPDSGYVPVVPFNFDKIASSDGAKLLDERGFALRGGLHCSPAAHTKFGTMPQGMIRASYGAFNSLSDSENLANAVAKILKNR